MGVKGPPCVHFNQKMSKKNFCEICTKLIFLIFRGEGGVRLGYNFICDIRETSLSVLWFFCCISNRIVVFGKILKKYVHFS